MEGRKKKPASVYLSLFCKFPSETKKNKKLSMENASAMSIPKDYSANTTHSHITQCTRR